MARIAYVHQYFATPESGDGIRSYEFGRRLADAGHEVHMIASDTSSDAEQGKWRVEKIAGMTVHWLGVPYSNEMSFRRRIVAFFQFAVRAISRTRKVNADLIFATSTPLTVAVPAVFGKWGRSTPMVFEVRDLWPEMPIAVGALKIPVAISAARALERFAYRNADRVVALSPGMADGVVATGYDPDRVSVIPNAADLDVFAVDDARVQAWLAEHPELQGRQLITYAGTFGLINGVSYLVRVAEHLADLNPNAAVLLIGSGAEAQKVKELAEELGLLGMNVFIENEIPKRDIPAVFSAATISTSVFLPIKQMEVNSANKFFDGLASGRPVAINYGGWQRELLEASSAGVYLDSKDPKVAAETLNELLGDDARLAQYGRNARALAETRFSRDTLANELIDVLDAAMGKTRELAWQTRHE